MKMKKNCILLFSVGVCLLLAFIHACAPVNRLTQVKKTPRLYSENYNYPNVFAERSEMNKRAWVVWSDRDGNTTSSIPGGTLPHTELKLLDPLLVIGINGDYYKLVRYDESILKNDRLTDRKKAEYCGWLHKDRLLLFNSSLTEVRNGIRLKSLTAIRGVNPVLEAGKYFSGDSVVLFSGPALDEPAGESLGLGSIVYVLKQSERDTRVLVCTRPDIRPGNTEPPVAGWIDAALAPPLGQRMVLTSAPKIPDEASPRAAVSPVKAFYPMLFSGHADNALVFRTLDAYEVVDRSDNRIFNVDGNPVTWTESQAISRRLRNTNVVFAFELTEGVIGQLPALTGALQHLKTVFENSPGEINYSFSAVLGDRTIPPTSGYTDFYDRLVETAKKLDSPSRSTESQVLEQAVQLAAKTNPGTTMVIHIGEKAPGEAPPQKAVESFIRHNCRLLSYQVFSGKENEYNSFVLQSVALIEAYGEAVKEAKREMIFYPGRIRQENRFNENARNAYILDFPSRSMTQGMVIFPEKGRMAEPELLVAGIDSLVRQVERDNLGLIADMDRAFRRMSGQHSRYGEQFAARFGLDPAGRIPSGLAGAFPGTSPQWVDITSRISLPLDSAHLSGIALLLNEAELEELAGFIGNLSSMPLEKKSDPSSVRPVLRSVIKVRNELKDVAPDAGLDIAYSLEADTIGKADYVNTGKVRKHLKKTYLKALEKCAVDGNPKKLTLARAQELITTAPTLHPELGRIRIGDLDNRRIVTDKQLDNLVRYFGEKKKEMGEAARPAGELNAPGGIKYVLLPLNSLP